MNDSNTEPRFDGNTEGTALDDGRLLHEGGVLPKDFPERLERLKQASGLSWGALARAIGVDRKALMRWRKKGVEPCGGAMHAIFRFAARMPGDLEILIGDGFPDDPHQGGRLDRRPRWALGATAGRWGRNRGRRRSLAPSAHGGQSTDP